MPPYLIFDFDGVIGDTWETCIATHLKRGSRDSRESAIEEMNDYFNRRPHHTKNHTLNTAELAKEYTWTTESGTIMHEIGFNLFDEFVDAVLQVSTPYKAVVSSGSTVYVVPAMNRTAINPTHILAFEDHHSKEEKIEAVCRDWNVATNQVYYFTDSLADVYELQYFISPEKLFGVAWGFSGKENLLRELKPQYILDTPEDFLRLFTDTK
jgi:phosphoglycolate phosphatase-like HAD superfamily hydrolase